MNTNKAAYWIAVGALAFGLNSEYRQGDFAGIHRVADSAGAAVCRITARAKTTLEVATFLTSSDAGFRDALVATADQAEMARAQGEMLREQNRSREEVARVRDGMRDRVRDQIRAEADLIRARAEMRRAEIEIQLRTHSPFTLAKVTDREVSVFCPTSRARIPLNHAEARSRDVEVRETF